MSLVNSEVHLSINLQGRQAIRGSFTSFHGVDLNGKEINGIRTERPTSFCVSKKSVRLGNEFVRGALAEPPSNLKYKLGLRTWLGLTETKRISLHVKHYIRATHPEHRGYVMEVI